MKPEPEAVVYFLQCGDDGPIKIGWAAASRLVARISVLQVAHYQQLFLLGLTEGGVATEKRWHARFDDYRIRGEWFEPAPELLAEIRKAVGPSPRLGD